MRMLRRALAVVGVLGLVTACGGGGAEGTASTSPANAQPSASQYKGSYVSRCSPVTNATNFETTAPLYAKFVFSVEDQGASSVTRLGGRLDLFDDNACSGMALGAIPYYSNGTALKVVSEKQVSGGVAHRVVLTLLPSNVSYTDGPTSDTVLLGSALRLKVPRIFATGFYANDLWRLEGDSLFDGASIYDSEGYPQELSSSVWAQKTSVLPPEPDAPCPGAVTMRWSESGGGSVCDGQTTPTGSGRSIQVAHSGTSSLKGVVTATCSKGTWERSNNGTCADSYQPKYCPVQVISWSSGENRCSGTAPRTFPGNTISVINSEPGLDGGQVMQCSNDGVWSVWANVTGRCDKVPPPKTDPLQIARDKNCLACHSVSEPGYSASMPSFSRIASFYRSNPPASGVLERKVKNGGNGTFGSTPMPANPQISDAELLIVIPWILSQP
ncbi:MAG: c-type cytochrome [Rhodoferax sp.]